MPTIKTEATEIVTGLATLGFQDLETALGARPAEMLNVTDRHWDRVAQSASDPELAPTLSKAWESGLRFLRARDGLRGRRPFEVEWTGPQGAVGDQPMPIDLRIDHVYLVSCKHLSKVLRNPSPANLFERLLTPEPLPRTHDWYSEVAPTQFEELYEIVRGDVSRALPNLPASTHELTSRERSELSRALSSGWSEDASAAYRRLGQQVSAESARRWRAQLGSAPRRELMLWRLLRIGSAPYFLLGSNPRGVLGVRVQTQATWRERNTLLGLEIASDPTALQPKVRWRAAIRSHEQGTDVEVLGHIQIRWSHGRFGSAPEAKVYLDTDHLEVPGYVVLGGV